MSVYPEYYEKKEGLPLKFKYLIALIVFVIIFAILGAVKYFQIISAMSQRPTFPAFKVTTAEAELSQWTKELELVGEIAPVEGVVLKAQEAGRVSKILASSGQTVQQGDVLLELDSAVESAQLAAARAKAQQALSAFNRAKTLIKSKSISKAEFETRQSDSASAQAEADRLKATIERRFILAPFSGRTGIRSVNVGEMVSVGQDIMPIYNDRQVYVNFDIPEQAKASLTNQMALAFSVDALSAQTFTAEITAISPQVDPDTRTIALQAKVDNDEGKLTSGMSARVTLPVGAAQQVITIPSSSISYAPYGNSVYVVKKIKSETEEREYLGVEQRFVQLGANRGSLVAVLTGLKENDVIVTSGAFKLRPGLEVEIDNTVKPNQEEKPTPQDA
mgnify:CR=1 FL=1